MYADDFNLTFTACSFPRLQHDTNQLIEKLADSKQAHFKSFKNGVLILFGLRQRIVSLTQEKALDKPL